MPVAQKLNSIIRNSPLQLYSSTHPLQYTTLYSTPQLDLYDLAVNAIDGRDGEQVHLPRGLAGSFETAQMDHVHE